LFFTCIEKDIIFRIFNGLKLFLEQSCDDDLKKTVEDTSNVPDIKKGGALSLKY